MKSTSEGASDRVLVDRRRPRKPTRPIATGLRITIAMAAAFALVTWLFAGPLDLARVDVWLGDWAHRPDWRGVLIQVDRIGQRAVCLPVLGAVVVVVAWQHRTLRPVLLGVITVLLVNLLVLVLKLWLGRGAPYDEQFRFFADGQMYPSGHGANIVAMYGLAAYLIAHYGRVTARGRHLLVAGIGMLVLIMTATSMALDFHWFSDLVAGYLVGGFVLSLVVGIDAAITFRSDRLVVAPPVQASDVFDADEIAQLNEDASGASSARGG